LVVDFGVGPGVSLLPGFLGRVSVGCVPGCVVSVSLGWLCSLALLVYMMVLLVPFGLYHFASFKKKLIL
jgi:hypothetical protein